MDSRLIVTTCLAIINLHYTVLSILDVRFILNGGWRNILSTRLNEQSILVSAQRKIQKLVTGLPTLSSSNALHPVTVTFFAFQLSLAIWALARNTNHFSLHKTSQTELPAAEFWVTSTILFSLIAGALASTTPGEFFLFMFPEALTFGAMVGLLVSPQRGNSQKFPSDTKYDSKVVVQETWEHPT
ncbi:hypothetical protein AA313_de0209569 [Arthrobotrys entomopaga]|nr:hypothetical protein AA313_de0209569 [Arthrobotrys entomopaga]